MKASHLITEQRACIAGASGLIGAAGIANVLELYSACRATKNAAACHVCRLPVARAECKMA